MAPACGAPPFNDQVKGAVPLVALIVIEPFVAVGQEVPVVVALPVTPAPAVTVTGMGLVAHPLEPLTTTVCAPAVNPLNV